MDLTSTQGTAAAAPERDRTGLEYLRALPHSWRVAAGLTSLALSVACFARFGFTGRAIVGAAFSTVLVVLSAIDLDCRRIPNVIVLPATAIFLAAQVALYPEHALEWILASFLAALVLFLPLLIVPTGMGMGDVKLAALLGAVLGKSVAAAIIIGVVAGALYSLGILAREGMSARKKAFAYGPFLAFGGIVVLLLGGR